MLRRCVPLLACLILAVVGCGEEDDASSAGGKAADSRLTKDEWIERADAICLKTEDAQAEIADRIAEIRSRSYRGAFKKFVGVVEDSVAETRDGFDRLRALRPPADDEAEVDEWLSAVNEMLGTYDDLIVAVRKDNRRRLVKAIREGRRIDGEQEILADLLGLVDCRTVF